MKNSDDAIRQVLEGIRTAEAPQGLEERVLAAMKLRAGAAAVAGNRQQQRGWFGWGARRRAGYGIGGLVLAGLVLAVVMIGSRSWRVRPQTAGAPQQRATAATGAKDAAVVRVVPRAAPVLQSKGSVRRRSAAVVPAKVQLANTYVPSFPAPPLPLTDQEKLLLRMVRRADPVEMAMLSPEFRERQDADAKAGVDKFFEQPGQAVKR